MSDEPSADDDPIVSVSIHESTRNLIVTMLRTLAYLAEPGTERLSAEVRSYLIQSLDSPADLDLLFGELAPALTEVDGR
jgi:hypothetical protein